MLRLRNAALILAGLTVAGCSGSTAPSSTANAAAGGPGSVTGEIEACHGQVPWFNPSAAGTIDVFPAGTIPKGNVPPVPPLLPAQATGQPFASQTVSAGEAYQFVLSTGSYILVAHRAGIPPGNSLATEWEVVTVRTDETARQDFPNMCI